MTIKWVQQDPLVMNGEPFCYGSRLTVRQLLELRANGYDLTQILTDHPELRVLGVAAEVWDGAAENLVQENRALARLLDDAADETSLRLSALRAENERLRARLITEHIAAEASGDAARLDAIWAELIASTERRKLSISTV